MKADVLDPGPGHSLYELGAGLLVLLARAVAKEMVLFRPAKGKRASTDFISSVMGTAFVGPTAPGLSGRGVAGTLSRAGVYS